MLTVADVTRYLQEFAPTRMAAEWDNVGLLLGDAGHQAERVLTCLTLTPDVAREAIDEGVGLVVSHHPIFFRAIQKLTAASAEGRMVLELVRAQVAVYSPHTSFDNTKDGINDGIARRLGLREVTPLRHQTSGKDCKIVVFVPESDLEKVMDALFKAGAGHIGQYRECSFRLPGTGTFFGSDESNPTVGEKGRREEVAEYRLETVCPEAQVNAAISAMRLAHSYEEPAYEVYHLRPDPARQGQGRIGMLPAPVPFKRLVQTVKRVLKAGWIQSGGRDPDTPVQRVALACGAAGEFSGDAIRAKADVFLTGEMRFHDCLTARGAGMGYVLPGHYATERPGVEDLAARLAERFPEATVWPSRVEKDPLS